MSPELREHLAESAATEEFKAALLAFEHHQPQERVVVRGRPPRIKVERLMTKVLIELADHPIESVEIDGWAGCSNFTGKAVVEPGSIVIDFEWDCAWKAREAGYVTFGMPDQARAAMEFGYDCFRRFHLGGEQS